jgi:Putative porin
MRFVLSLFVISFFSVAMAQEKDSVQTKSKRDTTLLKRKVVKAPATSQSEGPKKRMYSKIINDSSKSVYGPKTSRWITEGDLFFNKKKYQPLDTAIHNFHRWTYVQKYGNKYQDLGIMGTALNPIFPVISTTIGASPGFKAYEPYYDTQEPRYYDSKSPYTRMYVVWGGNGRAMTHIEFTRNINKRWNFGFNYRPILVDRQQQRSIGDRQTISHYYDLFTTYTSKNEKYFLAFNYRRIRHRVRENGGISVSATPAYADYFDANALPALINGKSQFAETEELRQNFHVYHQYKLAKPFQVYQTMDYHVRDNIFRIDSTQGHKLFKRTFIDSAKSEDINEFKTFQTEIGIKGNAAFLFYDFYYKFRGVQNRILLQPGYTSIAHESYVGAKVALRFDSLSELKGAAELMLDGNYKLEGELNTPWLDASLTSVLAKSAYLQQAYRGSHSLWLNDLSNTFSNQLKGFLKLKWRGLYFNPGVTYTVLSNYIYFAEKDGQVVPFQSGGNQQVFSPEMNMTLKFFRRFYLRPSITYTQLWKNDDDAIRIPELFVNTQLTYENQLLNKALQLQLGVDVHYKSDYKALAYRIDTQSYYLQNENVVQGYPVIDVFLNAKIKQGRLFVKYHNAAQTGSSTGYMLTYGYPAVGSIIDFGFEIPLFD